MVSQRLTDVFEELVIAVAFREELPQRHLRVHSGQPERRQPGNQEYTRE